MIKNRKEEEEYFKRPEISNSDLGELLDSPRFFRDYKDGLIEKKATKSMDIGTAVHRKLLEDFNNFYTVCKTAVPISTNQKKFVEQYITAYPVIDKYEIDEKELVSDIYKVCYSTKNKSDKVIQGEAEKVYNELKGYINWVIDNDGKCAITQEEYDTIDKMAANVYKHKKAMQLLFPVSGTSKFEEPIYWKNGEIDCKSKLDVLNIDGNVITIPDLKTTRTINSFAKSFSYYDYGRQAAYYKGAAIWQYQQAIQKQEEESGELEDWTKVLEKVDIKDLEVNSKIIIISTEGTYDVAVTTIPRKIVDYGTIRYKELLMRLEWHLKNNLWDFPMEYYQGDGELELLKEE